MSTTNAESNAESRDAERVDAALEALSNGDLIPCVRIQSNVRFLKSEIVSWVAESRFRPTKATLFSEMIWQK